MSSLENQGREFAEGWIVDCTYGRALAAVAKKDNNILEINYFSYITLRDGYEKFVKTYSNRNNEV